MWFILFSSDAGCMIERTFTLNLPQGHRWIGDGRGAEVRRQRLRRVRGHSSQVLLTEHLPPGRRASERLGAVLKTRTTYPSALCLECRLLNVIGVFKM